MTALLAISFGAAGSYAHKTAKHAAPATLPVAVMDATVLAPATSLQNLQNVVQATPVLATAGASLAAAIAPTPLNTTREAELDEGQLFSEMLTDQGVDEGDALAAANALSKAYDVRRLRAGQDVTLSFLRTDSKETLVGAEFQPEDTKQISLTREADGRYTAHVTQIPVTRQRVAASGVIHSSLYEAADRSGVSHALMASLIRIYSHNIDFQRDVHAGDRFEVLYDQSKTAKGKAVGDSTVVYARFDVGGKSHQLYRVTFNDGTADYFDERGQSVKRSLLRTPVAAAHITSGYGMRVHPLLGYSKMHKGVDFGAPIGTPIFAAGSGTIDEVGFKGGYGRYVRIRHNDSMETAYAHMSRFASDIHQGGHVNQGEVIGYVGQSGRATGAHLHFEVIKNGQQINPMSASAMPTGRALDGKMLAIFKEGQDKIHNEFNALLTSKAASPTTVASNTAAVTPAATASH